MEKNRTSRRSLPSVSSAILLVVFALAGGLCAQQTLETNFRMMGPGITALFEPQRQIIQKCSAVIYDGNKEIAYGVVISPDGHIFTKASEIAGVAGFTVRVDKTSFEKVELLSVDETWDVALLKVEAQDLTPADYAESSNLPQGSWVVVNGATSRLKRQVLAGIISASPREIPAAGGAALGITLKDGKDKLEIAEVNQDGGAAAAGIMAGDVIVGIDGEKVSKMEQLTDAMKDRKVGDELKVTVNRKGKSLEFTVKLTAKAEIFLQPDRNDQMSGNFSMRRSGFPRVIQHDVIGNRNTMGGPVVDIRGKVIGMNIARANRCETFAIPVEELKTLAAKMMNKAGNTAE